MPYIKWEDRIKVNTEAEGFPVLEILAQQCDNVGDLNYAITVLLKHYLEKKGECYATHNDIMGMLECCKQEWYRKRVAPYEQIKEQENGSI